MKTLLALLSDPIKAYFDKGELKRNYYNPGSFFEKVILVTFTDLDIPPAKVSFIAGGAQLKIFPIGKMRWWSFVFQFFRLFMLVKEINPNIIRAYNPGIQGVYAVLIGRTLRLPVIISTHCDLDEQRKFNSSFFIKLRLILENISLRLAHTVICVTQYVAEYAARHKAKNACVVYNRVDLLQFNPINRSVEKGLIISVGRLEPPKYQECLIRALEGLPHARLLLIGQGPLESYLLRLVSDLSLEDRISFIRGVTNQRIHEFYGKAEIFAIATHYEGSCIPVLEAMASGIPVVASDIKPIREITDGAALLCQNNPDDFREKLNLVFSNEKLRLEMSKNGRLVAESRFDFSRLESDEKKAYESLLSKRIDK